MKTLFAIVVLGLLTATSWAGEKIDPAFIAFWKKFRTAIEKKDTATVADMTKVPYLYGDKKLDRAQFIKKQKKIFAYSRKELPKAEITKEKNGYYVFVGEEIYIFEKAGSTWKFAEQGVND